VTTDLSIIQLIAQASVLVQIVMLILLAASVASWYVIFRKRAVLVRARKEADGFEEAFWSGGDLISMYQRIDHKGDRMGAMERIFHSGFREFAKLKKQEGVTMQNAMDATERSMRIALNRELDALEIHLAFLATVGSTSPYVGLFGTVWGIMNSFRALGNVQQATLALVAPGIAEALIATAIGLFAAIPAVVAYNRYSNDVERLYSRYDIFKEEFSSILERQGRG
jgi:biopolymer transport protein TolQ